MYLAAVIAALLVIVLLTSCVRGVPEGVPTMSQPGVAQLIKVHKGEVTSTCTVFKVVGEDLAMTAGHCCGPSELSLFDLMFGEKPEDAKKITYHAEGPHAVPGAAFVILHDDDEHDACLLKGKMKGPALALAAHDPPLGAKVWTLGYPRGHFLISEGLWSGRGKHGSYVSVAVWGGASGSPILDSRNRVVGILNGYYPPMSNMAVVTPVEWVRNAYMFRP